MNWYSTIRESRIARKFICKHVLKLSAHRILLVDGEEPVYIPKIDIVFFINFLISNCPNLTQQHQSLSLILRYLNPVLSYNQLLIQNFFRAANAEINAAAMKKEFRTPHQKYVSNLMKAFDHMTIDKGLLKEELEVQGKLITARAERKSGKRLVLEGVTVASDPEVYRKIKALEDAAVEKKKRKVLG